MKSLLIILFASIFAAEAFDTKPFNEIAELTPQKIDDFFNNFTKNVEEYLQTQHQSISEPLKNVADCLGFPDVKDIQALVQELFAAFKDDEKSLSERKDEFCRSDVIEDILLCYDHVFTEEDGPFLNILKSATFLPLHELCTFEDSTEHLFFIQSIQETSFTDEQKVDLKRFDEIVNGTSAATESDNCLAFQISTAYSEVIDLSEENFIPLTRGMFTDAIQLYYSMKGGLPFQTFSQCFETVLTEE